MNPCKCGYYPDLTRCTCTEREIHGYLHRISRPLLDRMDLSAEMSRIPFEELLKKQPKGTKEEDSAAIRSPGGEGAEDSGAALRGDVLPL